ncbi:Maf family protein [methanotrophic endosymbiont of Bathymodiolus puteoserpentis (Logatchev)]|jgi:septum formation protein|uniref:Maf family protein n=1 Tax=methanotrophic endosymbiont of Bathymodiolus puteoserpentis (Logatchev) TaxID=343235 RepID=UPI0013CDA9DA|nr:Maf family protein [methanotrophic endosymbiont of Bathymodiolus puteoserpentis (Logatchev)]SHE21869.1 Septum formation protein Maf [methanotrophic endosymbiont of Bathymodiolus puteoserpentis (Logatchev)]
MTPSLILASASPRRSELLKQLGLVHSIQIANIDETPLANEKPADYVLRVAHEKSLAVHQQCAQGSVVLAADTSVVLGDTIMGKPDNLAHALSMLSRLSGTTHQVYSAVSLRGRINQQVLNISDVTFRTLSEQEIIDYWHTGEPADKAGAYAVQGLASIFIQSIQGSFSGIMGLPLFETAKILSNEGIKVFNE